MFASPKRSALLSWLLHCGAILLILATTGVKPQLIRHTLDVLWMPADIDSYKMSAHSGGGGGGVHADSPASRGEVPRFAHKQFSFPTVDIQNATPILPMEPTLIGDPDIKLAAFNYKQWGDPNGVLGTRAVPAMAAGSATVMARALDRETVRASAPARTAASAATASGTWASGAAR